MTNIEKSVQEALERLSAQGINELPEYVAHILRSRLDGTRADFVPASQALVNSFTTVDPGSPIEHTPPEVGLTIDGVEYAPDDVIRFNGRPLHYVVTTGTEGMTLTASTDGSGLKAAMTEHIYATTLGLRPATVIHTQGGCPPEAVFDPVTGGWSYTLGPCPGASSGSAPKPKPKAWEVPYTSLKMFSDVNFSGDWFWLNQGRGYRDLRKVERDKGIFSSDDWNDKISSVTATANPVTYYEHIDFGGSSLSIPAGEPQNKYSDLHVLGWGDRISSVIHW